MLGGTGVALRQVASHIRVPLPPYGVPPDLLYDTVERTGLLFRHVLIRAGFDFTSIGDRQTFTFPLVLVHLCTHETLRAHHFHIFASCGDPDSEGWNLDLRTLAEPFIPVTRSMGLFPIRFPPEVVATIAEGLIPPGCNCLEWSDFEPLYNIRRPRIVALLEILRNDNVI